MNDDRLWDNSFGGSSPRPYLYMVVLDLNDAGSSLVAVPGTQGSSFVCVVVDFLAILWSQGFRALGHHLNDGLWQQTPWCVASRSGFPRLTAKRVRNIQYI